MKKQILFLLCCLPAFLLAQTDSKSSPPEQGSWMMSLYLPSAQIGGNNGVNRSWSLSGEIGLGYMAGENWMLGTRLQTTWRSSRFLAENSRGTSLGLSVYSRHFLGGNKVNWFGEVGLGGQQNWSSSTSEFSTSTSGYGELRFGVQLPLSSRFSLKASNGIRRTEIFTFDPSQAGQWDFLVPKIGVNIHLGQKR